MMLASKRSASTFLSPLPRHLLVGGEGWGEGAHLPLAQRNTDAAARNALASNHPPQASLGEKVFARREARAA